MDKRAALYHVMVCLAFGGVVSWFSEAKWFAASFWVSAALFLNGSLALYEDARPGGFDDPEGRSTPAFTMGLGALAYWSKSLAITTALGAVGFLLQEYA